MKIKVSITREYDTEGDHAHLFEGMSDPERYALYLYAEDLYKIAGEGDIAQSASVEVTASVRGLN